MQKKVIINADDFGISLGTNKGIEKAHKDGILTSASIMPTGAAFLDAVKIAKRNRKLGIGIHLSLTWGKSILPREQIPDLIDKDNYFYPSFIKLFIKLIFKRKIIKQIESELQAQVNFIKKYNIKADHLNGQIHIHFIPWVFPIVMKLAEKNNIDHVRIPLEPLFSIPFSFNFFKWMILRMLGILIALINGLPNNAVAFYGILYTSKMSLSLIKKILLKDKNTTEILSHPGEYELGDRAFDFNRQGVIDFIGSPNRRLELNAILDPSLPLFIKENNIRLASFSDIKKT